MAKVPVIILSGFLGSGKTSLLIKLLKEAHSRNLKPGVLMNELGQSDVDSELITSNSSGVPTESLLDGCICCNKKSEVAACIKRLYDMQPDVIFIELTGVANPEEVADVITEPSLFSRVKLKHIITVLDAEWVLEYNSIFNIDRALKFTLRRQIEVADTILINKTDLVSTSELNKIKNVVNKQNKTAQLHFTKYSKVDMSNIFLELKPIVYPSITKTTSFKIISPPSAGNMVSHHCNSSHEYKNQTTDPSFTRVQTVTFHINENISITVKKLEQFLQQHSKQLLRAKGYVNFSSAPNMLIQYAGKRIIWEETGYSGPPYLVLIGIELNKDQIESDWIKLTS